MSRVLPTSVVDALDDDVIYPFFAVEMNFDSDNVLRLWTGVGTLTFEGVSWAGAGTLLGISSVEETTETAARGADITITGLPSEVLALALSTPYQGRTCKIYFGLFKAAKIIKEDSSFLLLEDGSKIYLEDLNSGFTEIFTGYMDQMNVSEDAQTGTIQVSVENKLIDLERARVARYTAEYQRSRNIAGASTDAGFDFVADMQDQKLAWGRSSGS
jgi:hypothetical protein